jgi:hypothetical protein
LHAKLLGVFDSRQSEGGALRITVLAVGLLTLMSASVASASPIIVPPGLAPGSTYFLAFVTRGTHDATSTNIADYDAFVTAEANLDSDLLGLSTTWKAIGTTETDPVKTHIGVIGPLYSLFGEEVATSDTDLFDGTISAPIEYDQYGNFLESAVWTGTEAFTLPPHFQLGTAEIVAGYSIFVDSKWLTNGIGSPAFHLPLFGISGPLTVPSAPPPVPEPASVLLLGTGLVAGARRWRTSRGKI